jgi:hypothetical protein
MYHKINCSDYYAIAALAFGLIGRTVLVSLLILINNAKSIVPLWVSLIYFLTQRTLFVIFTGFTIMPFVLQAPLINFMRQF